MGQKRHNLLSSLLWTLLGVGPFSSGAVQALVISEISYHPRGGGQALEFIEIHNELYDPVDLTGCWLSGVGFSFPDHTFLEPRESLVVCADEEAVRARFGIDNTIGNWDPGSALSNRGERIELLAPGGLVMASVTYRDRAPWPAGADGTGHTLELVDPYVDARLAEHWVLSAAPGGSPGHPGSPRESRVLLNEAFLDAAGSGWLELYNPTAVELDLDGYRLSTSADAAQGIALPAGTSIDARGFLVLTADQLPLALSPRREGLFVALWAPDGEQLVDAAVFSPLSAGHSDARLPDGARGRSRGATPTSGAPNRTVTTRDVVINELHYHPLVSPAEGRLAEATGDLEFIELFHRGDEPVSLDGWRLRDGVRFDLPAGTTLNPGDYLVVARDPETVRQHYGLGPGLVVGPLTQDARENFGRLSNAGERLTLVDSLGNTVDSVHYHDGGEWPVWADGGGSSLELIDPRQDNEISQSWDASLDEAPAVEISYRGRFEGPEDTAELHLLLDGRGIARVDRIAFRAESEVLTDTSRIIPRGGMWRFFKGDRAAPDGWRAAEFDDDSWAHATAPIGFGFGDEGTTLDDMQRNYVSAFFRREFTLDDGELARDFVLEVEYDDGFAAYLNGVEVATEHLRDGQRGFEARASGQHHETHRVVLPAGTAPLRAGRNTIAVQVHNALRSSSDFRFDASLSSGRLTLETGPNLIANGDFEPGRGDAVETPEAALRWPRSGVDGWRISGTHVRSGPTEDAPLEGVGSLKIVATAGGDNKVNRIETTSAGLLSSPDVGANMTVSLVAQWVIGSPRLLTHGAYSDSRSPSYAASHRLPTAPYPGTPGARNSVTERQLARTGSANLGPVFSNVRHAPAVPAAQVPVRVSARVSDADGVQAVRLHYTLERPRAPQDPAVVSLSLRGPDAEGSYHAEVPGQAEGTRVVYWLTAEDSRGERGRYPLAHLERSHPLVLAPSEASPEDARYCVYQHASVVAAGDDHLAYRFVLHGAAEEYLDSRLILSNDPVESTLIFEERDVYEGTKIRFSGSPFARGVPWQGSFRVRLPKDRPLHGRLERFNLENHQGQGGRDARERVSHYLIRHNQGPARVPYAQQWLIRMDLGERVQGAFKEHVEVPNREYLSRWFPDDDRGPFFEMDDRHNINNSGGRTQSQDGRLLYPPYNDPALGEDREEYRYYFSPRGGNLDDDFTPLIDLARLMTPHLTPDDEFDRLVEEHVDVEQFLRVWSVRLNTADWDTWGARRGKNAYFYLPEESGRWLLLPWDMELTYEDASSFLPPALSEAENRPYENTFTEVERFLNRPHIKRRYYAILRELAENVFTEAFYGPYLDELESIGLERIGTIRGFLRTRARMLRNAVAGQTMTDISFSARVAPRTTSAPEVTLSGVAPLEIREVVVLVDGAPPHGGFEARLGVSHPLQWEARGTLAPGAWSITCLAFDEEGALVGSRTLDVLVSEREPESFLRGDADRSGRVNLADAIRTLDFLVGTTTELCLDAADTNDSGRVDLIDVLHTVEFLFRRGPAPAAPYPAAGSDPTDDGLDCGR